MYVLALSPRSSGLIHVLFDLTEVFFALFQISTAHNLGEQLDEKQALVRQFAKVLEFILKFDEYKMLNPALQNDFSYYRRTTQRSRHSELQSNGNEV